VVRDDGPNDFVAGHDLRRGHKAQGGVAALVDVLLLNFGHGLELDAATFGGLRQCGGAGAQGRCEQRCVKHDLSVRHGCVLLKSRIVN
jgi:hypothetical protein